MMPERLLLWPVPTVVAWIIILHKAYASCIATNSNELLTKLFHSSAFSKVNVLATLCLRRS